MHEKRILSVELNLARRNLIDAQKVLAGQAIEPDIAERMRLRQIELGRERGGQPLRTNDLKGERAPMIRDEMAKTVGLGSGRTWERGKLSQSLFARKRQIQSPKVSDHVFTVTAPRNLARDPDDPFYAFVAHVEIEPPTRKEFRVVRWGIGQVLGSRIQLLGRTGDVGPLAATAAPPGRESFWQRRVFLSQLPHQFEEKIAATPSRNPLAVQREAVVG